MSAPFASEHSTSPEAVIVKAEAEKLIESLKARKSKGHSQTSARAGNHHSAHDPHPLVFGVCVFYSLH